MGRCADVVDLLKMATKALPSVGSAWFIRQACNSIPESRKWVISFAKAIWLVWGNLFDQHEEVLGFLVESFLLLVYVEIVLFSSKLPDVSK